MIARETIDNASAVCREIGNGSRKTILDIGCGTGELCRALVGIGANVTGIDPGKSAIEQAMVIGGGATYHVATLDDLDASANSYDVVIFCTSLHHIPDMADALQGAVKLVKEDGKIIVLEPQTDVPLYPVYRWLDDEKQVQIEAQMAVSALIDAGNLTREKTLFLNKKYRYRDINHLIKDMQEVDASRSLGDKARKKMSDAFDAATQQDDEGDYIDHWYRLDVLEVG